MGLNTSSATKRSFSSLLPIGATVRAVFFVSLVLTVLSETVLHTVAVLSFEKSEIPDIGWLMLLVAVSRTFMNVIPRAIGFVLIFGFAKEVYIERWALYGLLWSLVSGLRWVLVAINTPRGFGSSALFTALSVAGLMLSAYLTKTIYDRADS